MTIGMCPNERRVINWKWICGETNKFAVMPFSAEKITSIKIRQWPQYSALWCWNVKNQWSSPSANLFQGLLTSFPHYDQLKRKKQAFHPRMFIGRQGKKCSPHKTRPFKEQTHKRIHQQSKRLWMQKHANRTKENRIKWKHRARRHAPYTVKS